MSTGTLLAVVILLGSSLTRSTATVAPQQHQVVTIHITTTYGPIKPFPDGTGWYREELSDVVQRFDTSDPTVPIVQGESIAKAAADLMNLGFAQTAIHPSHHAETAPDGYKIESTGLTWIFVK